ncbi:MAG TPA: FxLYD domain-containing protein [Candidatus Acidoferrales bacterium]|nr:FxLYD domain-containing protein [Candidatus Acidoferrales bacterium]
MKRALVLALMFVGGLHAGDRPITISAPAEKQLVDLGLKVETIAFRTDHKLVSYLKLVVALRNTTDHAYDRVAVTMVLLDKDGNETGISQTVDLQDVTSGSLAQVTARARFGGLMRGTEYRVAKVEAFQKAL